MNTEKEIEFNEVEFDDRVIRAFEETFYSHYSCIRVWSAWSVNTMTKNDFVSFNADDECFYETFDYFKDLCKKDMDLDVAKIISDYIIDNGIELLYNDDIDNNFSEDAFSESDWKTFDFSLIQKAVNDIKILSLNPITEKKKSKNRLISL